MKTRRNRARFVAAVLISAALLVPLAVFASTSFATSGSSSAAQYQYKITICHHANSRKTVTIRINSHAWPAHQRHGDTLGPCATGPSGQHSTTTTTGTDDGKGHGNGRGHGDGNGKANGHGK
jgi:hypothetical protein